MFQATKDKQKIFLIHISISLAFLPVQTSRYRLFRSPKMVFAAPFLACHQDVVIATYQEFFAVPQSARSQPFCSASGVGVTGLCPRIRPGVQRAALEDTRCRHQHLLRQVSRVMYDFYVVHCNILAAFYLHIITSSFPHVIRSDEQQPRPMPRDLSFRCENEESLRKLKFTFMESTGKIVFLGTKNL